MILTVEEVLTRIEVRMNGKVQEALTGIMAGPLGLANVEVAPLTLEDDQVSFNACLALLARLDQYDITTLNDVAEEVFPPFAQSILNILELFPEIIHSERFKPAVEVGAKLFYVYYEHNGAHAELAYKLAEELREFPLSYQPNWLNEYIDKLHTRDFAKFSVETLTHMAQHSLKFQQGMAKDDQVRKTVIFGAGAETLETYSCHTNTFLSALVGSTVEVPPPKSSAEFTVWESEMTALAVQLLRLEGLGLKVPCVGVDYLLVGELIGYFHQVHTATESLGNQELYVQACAVLVDLVVMELDDPKQKSGYIFRRKADGVARIDEKAFTTLLRGFERTTGNALLSTPFKEFMDRYRRVVVGSALHSQAAFAQHPMSIMVAEHVIARMFAHCKEDLRDPEFLKFIGKSGRLNAASRISSFNDPEFLKEFLKANKDLRGAALESELGL